MEQEHKKSLFWSEENVYFRYYSWFLLQQNILLESNEYFLWKFTLHKYCHYSNGEIKMKFHFILRKYSFYAKPKELTFIKGSSWQFSTITELEHFSGRRINFSPSETLTSWCFCHHNWQDRGGGGDDGGGDCGNHRYRLQDEDGDLSKRRYYIALAPAL